MGQRYFKDRDGRVWLAWEVKPSMTDRRVAKVPVTVERRKRNEPRVSLPGGFHNGWLAFESRAERRRLVPTPEGWDDLSERQLNELLERAKPSARPRRLIE